MVMLCVTDATLMPFSARRSSTRRVTWSLTCRAARTGTTNRADAVTDAVLPPGEDADPTGERPEDLLHGQRETGGEQADDHSDPPGERPP